MRRESGGSQEEGVRRRESRGGSQEEGVRKRESRGGVEGSQVWEEGVKGRGEERREGGMKRGGEQEGCKKRKS